MVYLVSLVIHDPDTGVTYEVVDGIYRSHISAMQAQVDALVENSSDDSVIDVTVTPWPLN